MKSGRLYIPIRECAVCGRTAAIGTKRSDSEPVIVAITPIVYRRGAGKGRIQNAPKIQVCDDCLALALSEPRPSRASLRLWDAFRASLSWRYGSMVEADTLSQVKRPKVDGGLDCLAL